jgi:hypothetical protein
VVPVYHSMRKRHTWASVHTEVDVHMDVWNVRVKAFVRVGSENTFVSHVVERDTVRVGYSSLGVSGMEMGSPCADIG